MSQVAFSVDASPAPLPFVAVVETLAALDVPFQRKGAEIALKDPRRVLTGELIDAVREHKTALLSLCDLRDGFTLLCGRIVFLRCENPPKGSRENALKWVSQQIENLAAQSVAAGGSEIGFSEIGFPDPLDEFADNDQIAMLRHDLAELEAGPYPVPLPDGCVLLPQANFDVFAAGRLYNGQVCNGQLYNGKVSRENEKEDRTHRADE